MEDYNIFGLYGYGDPTSPDGGFADPSLGTNVNYATAGGSGVENFAPGQVPNMFLSAGSNYADTGGVKAAAPGTALYDQLQADARTRAQQGILKVAALVGGGAALGATPWGSATPGMNYGSGIASASDAAFGAAAPAGATEAPISLFGAGGAPSTLSGLGGGGLSSLNAGLAGAVDAGIAPLTAGIGGAAGATGGVLAGLGSGSVPSAGAGIAGWGPASGTIGALPPAASSGGGILSSLLGGGAAQAGGGVSQPWWQQILSGLGGQPGNLGSNIFAGLQGAGLLGSLFGGNSISDALGLTGANASKFAGVNVAGPGGAASTYNPDTNTVTGTRGNLDPFQAQLAQYAGNQLGQTDFTKQSQNVLDLFRQRAAPQEQRQWNAVNNNLFSRGQLGAGSTATGEAYRGLSEAQNSADLERQIAAQQFGQSMTNDAYTRAIGAGNASGNLQLGAAAPTLASMQTQTPGQTTPLLNFLNQFLTGAKP